MGYARLAGQLREYKSMAKQQPHNPEVALQKVKLESILRGFETQNRDILSKIVEHDVPEIQTAHHWPQLSIPSPKRHSKSSMLQNSGYFGRFDDYSRELSGAQSGSQRRSRGNDKLASLQPGWVEGDRMLRELMNEYHTQLPRQEGAGSRTGGLPFGMPREGPSGGPSLTKKPMNFLGNLRKDANSLSSRLSNSQMLDGKLLSNFQSKVLTGGQSAAGLSPARSSADLDATSS